MQQWMEQLLYFACDYRGESFEQVLSRFKARLKAKGTLATEAGPTMQSLSTTSDIIEQGVKQ